MEKDGKEKEKNTIKDSLKVNILKEKDGMESLTKIMKILNLRESTSMEN